VAAAHFAGAPVARHAEHGSGAPFILSVGTLTRHKNYVRLIEAFARISRRDVKLVIAGKDGNAADEVRAAIRRYGVRDRVVITGYVDEPTLDDLSRRAALFVTTSEYEGFGITVLEAMQRGIPVACSRSAALPEVAGTAAILFNAGSARSIAGALMRGFGDAPLRSRLRTLGAERASRFTWRAAAERAIAVLH
jgi:glycosyltransferase involved in cell wall biosynthesis